MQYDQETDRRVGGKFVAEIGGPDVVRISKKEVYPLFGHEMFKYWPFGVTDYLEMHVLKGEGRRLFSPETNKRFERMEHTKVRNVGGGDAIWCSRVLIETAIRTSTIVRPDSQIGGQIYTYYINCQDRAASLGTSPVGAIIFPEEHEQPSTEKLNRNG